MHARRWVVPGLLILLFAAVGVALFATRDLKVKPDAGDGAAGEGAAGRAVPVAPDARSAGAAAGTQGAAAPARPPGRRQRPFDLQPLLTARRVGALAEQPEEVELARQAERLADHVVDLAFADTLQQILDEPPELTPELRKLAEAKARAQAAADAAAARVDALTREAAGAGDGSTAQRLEVAKARLELARDELDDAGERLARAGGDPQARIQRLRAEYGAAQKLPAAAPPAAPASAGAGSVVVRLRAWMRQRDKVAALEGARQEALDRVQRLERRTERVTKRIQEAEALQAKPPAEESAAESAARAEALRRLARDRRRITSIGTRLQDHQELAEVYADWTVIAAAQARAGLHRALAAFTWVLVALALMWAAVRIVDRALHRGAGDAAGAGTLRGVIRIAIEAVGALVILFILFGMPSQATTIFGLAGAGLTVALKDFIVAFFGWFVLMGRNGIRVGDWVEIEGVGGEVAEIGLIHTVLFETGSWSDAGHPTGRRVSFVNSFAIEGHYFNFTTSGQWMWDALQILVPAGEDPYPVIDGIQRLVEHETEANGKLAEQEWNKTTSRYRVRTFSAVPGINVVPTSAGVQLDVRYITRAHERHETRRRLYGAVVQLMHGKKEGAAPA